MFLKQPRRSVVIRRGWWCLGRHKPCWTSHFVSSSEKTDVSLTFSQPSNKRPFKSLHTQFTFLMFPFFQVCVSEAVCVGICVSSHTMVILADHIHRTINHCWQLIRVLSAYERTACVHLCVHLWLWIAVLEAPQRAAFIKLNQPMYIHSSYVTQRHRCRPNCLYFPLTVGISESKDTQVYGLSDFAAQFLRQK